MTTEAHPPVQFDRAIRRVDAMALVVGTMIGSGIFIVSADVQHSSQELVHAAGAAGFINKPVDSERVLNLVRGLVEGTAK